MNEFSVGSCISFGWETFKKRGWFLIGAYLLFWIVTGLIIAALNELGALGSALSLVAFIARVAVEMLIGMGSVAFVLKAHDDVEHVALVDFWRPHPFWKYTGVSILFFLISLGGFILLIIPGIIWSLMFGFATYLVIDKGSGVMEALKESKRITYGYKWELFLLGILSVLIMLLGFICLIVGVLVAFPVVSLAFAHAYRILQARAQTPAAANA